MKTAIGQLKIYDTIPILDDKLSCLKYDAKKNKIKLMTCMWRSHSALCTTPVKVTADIPLCASR